MRETFDNATTQATRACFGVGVALIGVACLGDATARATGVVMIAVGAGLAARAFLSARVVVTDDAVETCSVLRTRRFPLSALRGASVGIGTTGLNGFGREYLVLHVVDGRPFGFKELNAKPSPSDPESTLVRQATSCIEAAIQRHQAVPPA